MMHDENDWEWRVENAQNQKEFEAAMDGMLSFMVDEGMISMSWSEEHEELVFFMTDEQKQGIRVRQQEG